jgi:hypothetical protein
MKPLGMQTTKFQKLGIPRFTSFRNQRRRQNSDQRLTKDAITRNRNSSILLKIRTATAAKVKNQNDTQSSES